MPSTAPVDSAAPRENAFLPWVLPEALDALDEQAVPRWGAVSLQHMVEHLTPAFGVATNADGTTFPSSDR